MSSRIHTMCSGAPLHRYLMIVALPALLACGGGMGPTATEPTAAVGREEVTIEVFPLNLVVGEQGRVTTRAVDSKGRPVAAVFEWSSADPRIASVDKSSGTVTANAIGATTVTATLGASRATAPVSVRQGDPPARIVMAAASVNMLTGAVERLTAQAYDSTGRASTVAMEWSSADLAIATVGKTDGVVAAIALGTTTVTASVGTVRASTTISVITAPAGAFAFTRMSTESPGFVSDVLTSSFADRATQSVRRTALVPQIAAPAWSPDGVHMAVEVIRHFMQGCPYFDYASDLVVLDATASSSLPWRVLTTNGLSKSPSWSPDGKRIAYLQQSAFFSESDIYIIAADGGVPLRVTHKPGFYSQPRWSPDGARLVFSEWTEKEVSSEIFVINADGTGLTNVTLHSAYDADPSWSPDGQHLVFVSDRVGGAASNSSDVYIVDVDGSNVKRLTSTGRYSASPTWSPDGRQILFSSWPAIYVMNADGSRLVKLTTPPENFWDAAPAWRR